MNSIDIPILIGHLVLAGGFLIMNIIFKIHPPETINSWYGFRTAFSMKNQNTWDVANKYSGKVMLIASIINLVLDIFIFFLIGGVVSIQLEGICIAIFALISIIVVEVHLRKIFDKNGNPKIVK